MTSRSLACTLLALALLAVSLPAVAEDATQIYARSCAPCHGKEGRPSPVFEKQGVKNFTDPAWQKGTTDEQIAKVIREGKKGTMMASFDKQYPAQDIKALTAYIRKLGAAKK